MFDLHPMRALFLMSKSGFKPPTLKDRDKWLLIFFIDLVYISFTILVMIIINLKESNIS